MADMQTVLSDMGKFALGVAVTGGGIKAWALLKGKKIDSDDSHRAQLWTQYAGELIRLNESVKQLTERANTADSWNVQLIKELDEARQKHYQDITVLEGKHEVAAVERLALDARIVEAEAASRSSSQQVTALKELLADNGIDPESEVVKHGRRATDREKGSET